MSKSVIVSLFPFLLEGTAIMALRSFSVVVSLQLCFSSLFTLFNIVEFRISILFARLSI